MENGYHLGSIVEVTMVARLEYLAGGGRPHIQTSLKLNQIKHQQTHQEHTKKDTLLQQQRRTVRPDVFWYSLHQIACHYHFAFHVFSAPCKDLLDLKSNFPVIRDRGSRHVSRRPISNGMGSFSARSNVMGSFGARSKRTSELRIFL